MDYFVHDVLEHLGQNSTAVDGFAMPESALTPTHKPINKYIAARAVLTEHRITQEMAVSCSLPRLLK